MYSWMEAISLSLPERWLLPTMRLKKRADIRELVVERQSCSRKGFGEVYGVVPIPKRKGVGIAAADHLLASSRPSWIWVKSSATGKSSWKQKARKKWVKAVLVS